MRAWAPGCQRPDFRRHVERAAEAHRLGLRLENLQEAVLDGSLDDEAGAGDAALAGRREDAGDLARLPALSRSASAKTMKGDLPRAPARSRRGSPPNCAHT